MKKIFLFVSLAFFPVFVAFFFYATEYVNDASINDRFTAVDCIRDESEAGVTFLRPNCSGNYTLFLQKIPFRTNAMGLRDKDYSLRPPAGTVRILFRGTSVGWGAGLEEKDTVPRLLEKSLGAALKGKKLEVINGSELASSNADFVRQIPHFLVAYHPQIVLLQNNGGYEFNDLVWHEFMRAGQRKIFRADQYLPAGSLTNRITIFGNGLRFAWAVFKLRYRIWLLRKFSGEDAAFAFLASDTLGSLEAIHKGILAGGSLPVVVSIDDSPRTIFRKPILVRTMAPFSHLSPSSQFPVELLRNSPAYRAVQPIALAPSWGELIARKLLMPDYMHFTSAGAKFVADEMTRILLPIARGLK